MSAILYSMFKKFMNLLPIFIILFFSITNLFLADNFGLWRDESFSINVAKYSHSEILRKVSEDVHPPLHLFLVKYWMMVFGDSETSVRGLSILFNAFVLVVVYKISQRLFDSKIQQNLLLVAVATSVFVQYQSIEARAYTMLFLAFVGVVYATMNVFDKKDTSFFSKNSLAMIAYISLGLYSHVVYVFALVAIFIWQIFLLIKNYFEKLITFKELKLFVVKYFLIYLFSFLIFLPWLFQLVKQILTVSNKGFWLQFNPVIDLVNIFELFFLTNTIHPHMHYLTPIVTSFVGFFGVALWFFATLRNKQKYHFGVLLILVIALIFLASYKNPIFYIRYLSFLAPLIIVLAVEGLFAMENYLGLKKIYLLLTFFIIGNSYLYYGNIIQNPNFKEDATGALEYILTKTVNIDMNGGLNNTVKVDFAELNPEEISVVHPHGYTLHSFIYYANKLIAKQDGLYDPKFNFEAGKLYDPERKLPHFEGISAFDPVHYVDFDLASKRVLFTPYMYQDDNFNNYLISLGFSKVEQQEFNGGLKVDLWVR